MDQILKSVARLKEVNQRALEYAMTSDNPYDFQLLEEQGDRLDNLASQIKEQQREQQSRQQEDQSLCEQQHEDDQRQLSLEGTQRFLDQEDRRFRQDLEDDQDK